MTWNHTLLIVVLSVVLLAGASGMPAGGNEPQSFGECMLRGGDIRRDGDDISCRYIVSSSMRTYLTGKTECGDEVQYEIWDEIRSGIVTWPFAPHRTVRLPEVGETWEEASMTPVPCLDNNP